MLGDDLPPCELNRAPRAGLHFGFPYCHGGTIADPKFGKLGSCDDAVIEARDQLTADGVSTSYMRVRAFPFNDDVQAFLDAHERV